VSLAASVASRSRRPTASVYINGIPVRIPDTPGAITWDESVGQPIAAGSIRVINPPFTPEIRMPVVVSWGYDGHEIYAFHAFIIDPQRAAYPKAWTLQVRNILWLADFPVQKEDLNLGNNLTANEALTILLRDYSGIPEDRIALPTFEQEPGVPWTLGTMTPIAFGRVSPLQACMMICDPLKMHLYADAGGVVRARPVTGAPSDGPVAYYREGRDWLVSGAPTVSSNGDQIITRVIVTGAATNLITGPSGEMQAVNVKDSWQQDNHPYVPPGKHRELAYSNPLIEYTNEEQAGAVSCTGVAKALLLEHSRTPFTMNVPRQKVDPRLGIGMTVAAREPRLGLTTYRKFFVMSLHRSFGGGVFEESKVLDGGIGETGYSTIPPPSAAFIVRRMREWLDGVEYIELFLDGSPSRGFGTPETTDPETGDLIEPEDDTMDTIQSYVWSDNSDPPKAAVGRTATFLYPAGSPDPIVCLEVTDVTAKTDSTCQTIVLEGDIGDTPPKRELSFAAGATWYVTPNGGQTWRDEAGGQKAYAVPPISGLGSEQADAAAAAAVGLLATGDSFGGGLRRTLDYLRTASTEVHPEGTDTINFIWQHEKNPSRVWLAVDDTAYLSTDAGVTWQGVATPLEGEMITWIVNSVDDEQVVDFLAGPNMYTSWDAGVHLTTVLEGPPGSVARNLASGFGKHWIGFTGIEPGQSPLRSSEGNTAAFPVVDPEVLEIRALTMLADRPILVAIDQAGRIWHVNAEDGGGAFHMADMPEAP
jgi:hypothetical protein